MSDWFTIRSLPVVAGGIGLFILVTMASLSFWIVTNLADSETFVDNAVEAFTEEESVEALSALVVDRVAEDRPILVFVRPLLEDMVAGFFASETVDDLVTRIGVRLHGAMFDGSQDGVVIDLEPVGEKVLPPLERFFPDVAAEIPASAFGEIVLIEPGTVPELSPYARNATAIMWFSIIMAVILAGVIVGMRETKWKAVLNVGIPVMLAGILGIVVVRQARVLTLGTAENPNVEVLVGALYDQMVGALRAQGVILILAGLVVTVLGLGMRPTVSTDEV